MNNAPTATAAELIAKYNDCKSRLIGGAFTSRQRSIAQHKMQDIKAELFAAHGMLDGIDY